MRNFFLLTVLTDTFALISLAVVLFSGGCATTSFDTPSVLATEQGATESAAFLILKNNPAYIPAVREFASSILSSNIVDAAGIALAIASLPTTSAKDRDTIMSLGTAIEAALVTYQQSSNKPILSGDPIAKALIHGFADALIKACDLASQSIQKLSHE